MSSHHFVKEGQEPALFILHPSSLTIIEPLLEWAPVVLVSDMVLDEVLKWKIKIDVLLFRNAADSYKEKLSDQGPVEILQYTTFEHMLKVAFDFLIRHKSQGITLVMNATNEVFDQLLKEHDKLSIVIITAETRWSAISSEFEKWLPKDATLFVKQADSFVFNNELIGADGTNVFKTATDGTIHIKSDRPFWVGEPL